MMAAVSVPVRAQVGSMGILKGRAYFDLQKGLSDANEDVLTYKFRRVYFTYDFQISGNITGRFRTDVEQKTDGYYRLFMKHAYAEW